jgi:hypothetical protein
MFVRIRLDHLVCLCWLAGVSAFAHAQKPAGKTLGDMIDQAKRQQAQTLNPAPPPKVAALPAKKAPPMELDFSPPPKKTKPPLLWSLTGMNHQLVAEVIFDEEVHVLRLNEGDREIGPWLIERYGANGLYLVPAKDEDKKSKKSLFLPAPTLGISLERFDAALPATPQATSPNRTRSSSSELALVQDLSNILPADLLNAAEKAAAPPGINTNPPAPR